MLSWPAAAEVLERSACWAAEQKRCHQDLLAVGVLGSYTASPSKPTLPQWNPLLAGCIDTIDPDVCVDKDSSRAIIYGQISESREARKYW